MRAGACSLCDAPAQSGVRAYAQLVNKSSRDIATGGLPAPVAIVARICPGAGPEIGKWASRMPD